MFATVFVTIRIVVDMRRYVTQSLIEFKCLLYLCVSNRIMGKSSNNYLLNKTQI
jgi:hypothetical protein